MRTASLALLPPHRQVEGEPGSVLPVGNHEEAADSPCGLSDRILLACKLTSVPAVNESGIYTEADLKPYQSRLAELKEIINEGRTPLQGSGDPTEMEHDAAMNKLLLHKWDVCDRLVTKLASSLSSLSVELYPIHQRLITLRRSLASIAARPRPSINDVQPILAELRTIEDKRKDGKFVVEKPPAGSGDFFAPEKGQELLAGLLQDNFDICEDIKAREGEDQVARGPLQPIYDRLSEIRAQLERLVLTHRWTLRETVSPVERTSRLLQADLFRFSQDLYNYQNELARVDALRVDGKVRSLHPHSRSLGTDTRDWPVPRRGRECAGGSTGQCRRLFHARGVVIDLVVRAGAALPPATVLRSVLPPDGVERTGFGGAHANRQRALPHPALSERLLILLLVQKLNTIKRCLIEVAKQGGPFTARDLYPFQLALYQIDSLRKDGKFEGRDGSIPEGQAILNALLSETHELVSMLQEEQE